MIKIHTSMGDIDIELDHEKAPITATNFQKYVEDGFYNGTIFHRVIEGFMVQGGGMEPGMKEKQTGESIENEADNGLQNLTGTIAMARTNDPHSASAQFFINVKDNTFLDFKSKDTQGWGYCVFAKVVNGMDVVDKIKQQPTTSNMGHQDVPAEDIIIEKMEVI